MGDHGYVSILIHPACPGKVWLQTTPEPPLLRRGDDVRGLEVYYYAGFSDTGAAERYLSAELSVLTEEEIVPGAVRQLMAQLEPRSMRWRPWFLRSSWFWRGTRRAVLLTGITLMTLVFLRLGGGLLGQGTPAAVQAADGQAGR